MEHPPRIAALDSGVGGLTILRAIQQRFPTAHYAYGIDQANFPWGTKSAEDVIQYVHDFVDAMAKVFFPDILVVACNTASTVVLPSLRSMYPFPIVGVVPAIKPAAQLSQSRVIGLLATPGTVTRAYTDQLIREHGGDCKVIRVGSSRLVELAERKMRGEQLDLREVSLEIKPFFSSENDSIDVVVLGCTHFPHIKDELQAAAPKVVQWIDSGDAVAARVGALLSSRSTTDTSKNDEMSGGVVSLSEPGTLFYTGSDPIDWQRWGFAKAHGLLAR